MLASMRVCRRDNDGYQAGNYNCRLAAAAAWHACAKDAGMLHSTQRPCAFRPAAKLVPARAPCRKWWASGASDPRCRVAIFM